MVKSSVNIISDIKGISSLNTFIINHFLGKYKGFAKKFTIKREFFLGGGFWGGKWGDMILSLENLGYGGGGDGCLAGVVPSAWFRFSPGFVG
ncbi:MAG: hypothetical protein MJ175_07445 [Clostridia bacterium]|nr:hypothetical protein [Clostridia bacterium]